MTDRNQPLAPLNPETVDTLGPWKTTKTSSVPPSGGVGSEITSAVIGTGEAVTGHPPGGQRGTVVEIAITTTGTLVTLVRTFTRSSDGHHHEGESRQHLHETPAQALAWLIDDGRGKLGPAAKTAWMQACARFAPMKGMDRDRADESEQEYLLGELENLSSEWFVLNGADWSAHSIMRFPSGVEGRSNGHFSIAFVWMGQPVPSGDDGELWLTVEAARRLAETPAPSRLRELRRAIERRYLADGSFYPWGSTGLLISETDLLGGHPK
jgi:hypothetical protein